MLWKFEDATGVWRVGKFAGHSDFGGTDVTYQFICEDTGRLHLVSGIRLKNAERIWS